MNRTLWGIFDKFTNLLETRRALKIGLDSTKPCTQDHIFYQKEAITLDREIHQMKYEIDRIRYFMTGKVGK